MKQAIKVARFCAGMSALAFVASVVANSAAFWISWRVSYFAIASPADVVMGGFNLFFPFALVLMACALAFRAMEFVLPRFLAAVGLIEPHRVYQDNTLIGFQGLTVVALIVSVSLVLGREDGSMRRLLTDRLELGIYNTGLRVAPESDLDRGCVGGTVLWIGSTTAVLDCQQGVRILHKLDSLVSELSTEAPVEVSSSALAIAFVGRFSMSS